MEMVMKIIARSVMYSLAMGAFGGGRLDAIL